MQPPLLDGLRQYCSLRNGEQGRTTSMNPSLLISLACLGLLVGMPASAQEELIQETCPHPERWKPTNEELRRVLSDHQRWVEKQQTTPLGEATPSEGRANLCNADLRQLNLNEVDLTRAKLNEADLSGAKCARGSTE
jgi:hypothetical protein